MYHIPNINIEDYHYLLPKDRIAQFPLEKRDESKLVIYNDFKISESKFKDIPEFLPENSLLIYNETKVILARLLFQKETGAGIEIFCLEPVMPTREIQLAFQQHSGVVWKCLVGNSKKWKAGKLIKNFNIDEKNYTLIADRTEQHKDYSLIKFQWEPVYLTFSEILIHSGVIPLPPYMTRKAVESDKFRYQTIYARSEGSVAAPTAGLHFTNSVIRKLKEKDISFEELTLHIGAGTFKPVSSSSVEKHEMHTEKIFINKCTIKRVLENTGNNVIVVGTTTMRTIESLYWFGVKLLVDKKPHEYIDIRQWDPYDQKYKKDISVQESLNATLEIMQKKNMDVVSGQTQLMIVPGYEFKIPNILVTNFHIPQSTLLLLVSAFIGYGWKDVYQYALGHDFRFLSYGDSCLFFKNQ